jgi:hypothetical protein
MGGFLRNDAIATGGALSTYEALDEVVVDVSHLVRQVLVILYVGFFFYKSAVIIVKVTFTCCLSIMSLQCL